MPFVIVEVAIYLIHSHQLMLTKSTQFIRQITQSYSFIWLCCMFNTEISKLHYVESLEACRDWHSAPNSPLYEDIYAIKVVIRSGSWTERFVYCALSLVEEENYNCTVNSLILCWVDAGDRFVSLTVWIRNCGLLDEVQRKEKETEINKKVLKHISVLIPQNY